MDIKKADSKGRVSGFDPGYYYAIDRETGQFMRMAIAAPEALRRDMGTAEEAEMLLNQAVLHEGETVIPADPAIRALNEFIAKAEEAECS